MKIRGLIHFVAAMATLLAAPAAGQTMPQGTSTAATPARASPSLGRAMDDEILVDGSPTEAAASQNLTPGGQLWQMGRHQTRISRQEWLAAGRPEAEFERVHAVNRRMCVRTAVRILRYEGLARTFQALLGMDSPLAQRYIQMGGRIRTAAGVRQFTGLLQSALGFGAGLIGTGGTGGALYGGSVTAGAVGNEAQGQVHDESMLLSRDHGVYNLVATTANIEASLLSAEGNIDYWAWIMHSYCNDELGRMAQQQLAG